MLPAVIVIVAIAAVFLAVGLGVGAPSKKERLPGESRVTAMALGVTFLVIVVAILGVVWLITYVQNTA